MTSDGALSPQPPAASARTPPVTWRQHWRLLRFWAAVGGAVLAISLVLFPPSPHGHAFPVQWLLWPGLLLQPLLSTGLFAVVRALGVRIGWRGLHVLHVLALVGYLPLLSEAAVSARFFARRAAVVRAICSDVEVQGWRFASVPENADVRMLEVRVKSRAGGPLRLDHPMLYDAGGGLAAYGCDEPGCEARTLQLAPGQEATLRHGVDAPRSPPVLIQLALCREPGTEACAWWVHGDARQAPAGDSACPGGLPPPSAGWPL